MSSGILGTGAATAREIPRPPYDLELAPALAGSPLPSVIRPEMIADVRKIHFAAPIEVVLSSRAIDREDHEIDTPNGAVTVSVFTPRTRKNDGAGIYHLHGGGMIMGDRFAGIDEVLDWAIEFGATVVSTEYRLAPEYPDPVPIEDSYAGLVWMSEHARQLGFDPDRLMIAGTSAGGGLAAGVALMARDRGGPKLFAQMLMSPMLDDRDRTVSARQYSDDGAWSGRSNQTGWTSLLGDRYGTADVSSYAAPARAADLGNLPPAFIDVGSAEVFRDEDVEYASRLWAAGVQAQLNVWPGGFHIFYGAVPDAQLSVDARATRHDWVRRTLTRE